MQTWADLGVALLLLANPTEPAEEDAEVETDMAFLEYLGSWDESDEDWLLFDELDESADDEPEKDTDSGEEKDDER
ncbi:MAG: hypothetical protein AAF552_17895 [Pseudomonadota bacterium]